PRPWRRRVRSLLDLSALAGALKSLLAGGATVKLAGAAAVVAVTAVGATSRADERSQPPATPPPTKGQLAPEPTSTWRVGSRSWQPATPLARLVADDEAAAAPDRGSPMRPMDM